jgi:hypothetical protein
MTSKTCVVCDKTAASTSYCGVPICVGCYFSDDIQTTILAFYHKGHVEIASDLATHNKLSLDNLIEVSVNDRQK